MSFLHRKSSNPLAAIEARQRQEEHTREYARVAAENGRQRMIAEWEIKSGKSVSAKELYRHMDHVEAEHNDILVARRQHLAALLLHEKEQHEAMLAQLNETDEQRRERLTQQARELRTQREALRKGEASMKMTQLFRENNDELREAQSRIRAMHVADQRREQLEELQLRRAQAKSVDRFFEEQKDEADRQQRERAQRDLEEQYLRTQQMQRDLEVQVAANRQRALAEKDRTRQEDEEFFRLLKLEQEQNAKKDAMRREHQQKLAAEMKERNEELRRIKQEEYDKLRQEDKDALDELLRGIAEDERREAEHKRRERLAAKEHMKLVEQQMNVQAANESALDKLWQAENDKEWEKREQKWLAEQGAREQLLRNVVATRKEQIKGIRASEEAQREARRQEHAALIDSVKNLTDVDAKAREERRAAARANQEFLAAQVTSKRDTTTREREMMKTYANGAQKEQLEYQRALDEELRKLEAAKPSNMQHLKLLSSSRGKFSH